MKKDRDKRIPKSVVQRLVKYHMIVQDLREKGVEWISSKALAEALGLTSSTVRQDLLPLDFSGVSKRGYRTEGLENTLGRSLGADKRARSVIVGAGNLGKALALNGKLPAKGFDICGIFDCNPDIVGEKVGKIRIRPMSNLARVMIRKKIDIGIIAVPAESAQGVADILCLCGAKGLLNLSHAYLKVPQGVAVVDARLITGLQELWHAVQANLAG